MRDVDPSSNLDSLIDAAHSGDEPSGEDRERVRNKLLARIASGAAAGAVVATTSATATATAATGVVAKVVGAIVLVGAITTSATYAARERRPATHSRITTLAPVARRAPERPPSPIAFARSPTPTQSSTPSNHGTTAVPSLLAPPPEQPPSAPSAAPVRAPRAALVRAPAERSSAPVVREEPQPTSVAPRTDGPAVNRAMAPQSTLSDEISLIASARAALARGDARAALGELDRYSQRFARGMLRPESLAARVDALCALGDRARAHAVADAFVAEFPSSALAARVRARCP